MKTAGKLAAGWLIVLGFTGMTMTVSALLEKPATETRLTPFSFICRDFLDRNAAQENRDIALGGLLLGFPSLALGGWLALALYHQEQQEKKAASPNGSDRLQSTFYRLLEESNGQITILRFAKETQITGHEAKQYLDEKAKEFNGNFDVNSEGGISYRFHL
jgi:hypothetical protein